jgi:hypothetical protein
MSFVKPLSVRPLLLSVLGLGSSFPVLVNLMWMSSGQMPKIPIRMNLCRTNGAINLASLSWNRALANGKVPVSVGDKFVALDALPTLVQVVSDDVLDPPTAARAFVLAFCLCRCYFWIILVHLKIKIFYPICMPCNLKELLKYVSTHSPISFEVHAKLPDLNHKREKIYLDPCNSYPLFN